MLQRTAAHAARRLTALWLACALLLTLAGVASAEPTQRRTVRVGFYTGKGFQEYDEQTGAYSGSSYEYLMALRQYADWDYEFVHTTFSEAVRMLERGELDLVNNVSITEERLETLSFSEKASGSNYGCLLVPADDTEFAYNDYESFGRMKIGMMTRSIYKDYFHAFCLEHGILPQMYYFLTENEMNAAFDEGRIDARVVSSSIQDGSRVVAKFAPMDYYFATPKAETELLKELNAAMTQAQTDMPQLENSLASRYETRYTEQNAVLSASERELIAQDPTVTVAVSGAWYPVLYYDKDGALTGPLAEIYRRISETTGLKFQPVAYAQYTQSLEAVKNGDVDMIVEFPYDFIYAGEWNVQLSDKISSIDFYQVLVEGKTDVHTVAFYGEPYEEGLIRSIYGDEMEYVTYSSVEEAVDAVMNGRADCTFVNYYTTTKFRNRGEYLSLQYVLIPSLQYNFSFGLSQAADVRLKSIIAKGFHTIDNVTLESLFQASALTDYSPDMRAQLYQNPTLFITLAAVLAGALALTAAFFVYYQRMKKKNAELRDARHAQSVFLSRMSHDMRTPMNGILGLAGLSEGEPDVDVLRDNVRKIKESGDYLLSLINDTLDFQRIESGKMTLEQQIVLTQPVLQSILDIVRPAMEKKRIHFEVRNENADLSWYIRLDPVRFKQIFINLLSNAAKFTPEGGTITFAFGCNGREGMISHDYIRVSDTGIGMSEEFVQNRLFKPFSQESSAVSSQYAGSGLGLSIVKSLVELMGGRIEVESALGKGTTFTVYLDFERVEQEQAQQQLQQSHTQRSDTTRRLAGKRILLVEDHPLNAEIAKRLLAKAGCVVDWVSDGKQGVEAVQNAAEHTYDAVLMDVRMPVMNGLEATRAIRALDRPDARTLPILAMTANAYEEDVRQALDAGMNAHLSKPISPELLYDTLAEYLG